MKEDLIAQSDIDAWEKIADSSRSLKIKYHWSQRIVATTLD